MLKKTTILIISCLFAMTILSGCSYWNGHSYNESKQLVADALKEKYGEEFVVTDIGTGSGGSYYSPGYLKATCHPQNDKTIYFEAEYFEYGKSSYELDDLYIQSIVRKQIKDVVDPVLAEHFDDFATEVYIYGLAPDYDAGIRNPDEVTIKSFSRAISQNGKKNASIMWILIEDSQTQSQDKMLEILSGFTKELYEMKTVIEVHYVPRDVLVECKNFINDNIHDPNDIQKYIRNKYLIQEYYYVGRTQTLAFSKEYNYIEH